MFIQIKNLTKIYNKYLAVNKINFQIEKNKTVGLLGSNGCGKTTTIGMMLGLRVSLFYNAASVCEEIDPHRDSRASDHYVFPPEGCKRKDMPKTPKHHLSHTFKFKDYAPKLFHRIRLLNGISTKTCKKFCQDASQKANTKINLGHLKPPN